MNQQRLDLTKTSLDMPGYNQQKRASTKRLVDSLPRVSECTQFEPMHPTNFSLVWWWFKRKPLLWLTFIFCALQTGSDLAGVCWCFRNWHPADRLDDVYTSILKPKFTSGYIWNDFQQETRRNAFKNYVILSMGQKNRGELGRFKANDFLSIQRRLQENLSQSSKSLW